MPHQKNKKLHDIHKEVNVSTNGENQTQLVQNSTLISTRHVEKNLGSWVFTLERIWYLFCGNYEFREKHYILKAFCVSNFGIV